MHSILIGLCITVKTYPTETTIKDKGFILANGFSQLQRHGIASNSVHGSRVPSYHNEPESKARMRYQVSTSEVHGHSPITGESTHLVPKHSPGETVHI